jgi:hypothetical protein
VEPGQAEDGDEEERDDGHHDDGDEHRHLSRVFRLDYTSQQIIVKIVSHDI